MVHAATKACLCFVYVPLPFVCWYAPEVDNGPDKWGPHLHIVFVFGLLLHRAFIFPQCDRRRLHLHRRHPIKKTAATLSRATRVLDPFLA